MEHSRYYLILGFREQMECVPECTPWITEKSFHEPPRVDWITLKKDIPRSTVIYAMLVLDCGRPVSFETALEMVESMQAVYTILAFCSHVELGLSPLPLPHDIRSRLTVPLSKQWLLENCLDEIYSCFRAIEEFERVFRAYSVPGIPFEKCFPWINSCFRDEDFRRSAFYLYQSIKELGWDHCDWQVQGYDDQFNPHVSVSEAESAAQNAFKCIEAIIGEPTKTKPHKLAVLLRSKGFDPDIRLGFRKKDTLFNKIIEFHEIRDRVAAHGKSKYKRRLSVSEVIEMQALARYMLLKERL